MSEIIVVALGGNAILQSKQKGTMEEQKANVTAACHVIAGLIEQGRRVLVTHGNGPQVGAVLLQNEVAKDHTPAMPLDVCGAATQGQIGYLIQQSLANLLADRGVKHPVVSIVTQVEVDGNDQAFVNPTKPIGSFYPKEQADLYSEQRQWVMREDKARGGWRRVVPSPQPIRIVESEAIRSLLLSGAIVIASGGGGIPVVKTATGHVGVEAVIDKDLAAERLASDAGAQTLMILTDVPEVAIYFNTPRQESIRHMTVEEAERYADEGHFQAGSMGPKIAAALRFVRSSGGKSIITSLNAAESALLGEAGTHISSNLP